MGNSRVSPPPPKIRVKRNGSDLSINVIKMAERQITPESGPEKLSSAELRHPQVLPGV